MPHGTPDWGLVGPKTTVYGLDDLGEHAARLGSPHFWDRRGDTILMDDFEHGLSQADLDLRGANAAIALEGGHAMKGAFCAKLTGGSDGERSARLGYSHGLFRPSRLGLEFSFTLHDDSNGWLWEIDRDIVAGLTQAVVFYDYVNSQVLCLDSLLGWHTVATGVALAADDHIWNTGKLVVDFSTDHYVRFILNDQWWDLSPYTLGAIAAVTPPRFWFYPGHQSVLNHNPIAYCDCVVITQNEP